MVVAAGTEAKSLGPLATSLISLEMRDWPKEAKSLASTTNEPTPPITLVS